MNMTLDFNYLFGQRIWLHNLKEREERLPLGGEEEEEEEERKGREDQKGGIAE